MGKSPFLMAKSTISMAMTANCQLLPGRVTRRHREASQLLIRAEEILVKAAGEATEKARGDLDESSMIIIIFPISWEMSNKYNLGKL